VTVTPHPSPRSAGGNPGLLLALIVLPVLGWKPTVTVDDEPVVEVLHAIANGAAYPKMSRSTPESPDAAEEPLPHPDVPIPGRFIEPDGLQRVRARTCRSAMVRHDASMRAATWWRTGLSERKSDVFSAGVGARARSA
jgi:hypothetical protein